jgi:hypothetical protein
MNSLTPERFMIDDSLTEKDYDYLKRIAPAQIRPLFDIMEDFCDRLEYEGSFLYDEYPDKTTILTITDKIHEKLIEKESLDFSLKDFIQTILCDEILYRRCRYYRKTKMFE